ncbi:MAG: O-antigen ligase family protein [Candidatus Dormibacteria bacterium]
MVLRILMVALPVVLAGYALGDRGFAYLASVPGTPLFAGELILLLGGLFAAMATGYLRAALRNSIPMLFLLVFAAWGLARTLPLIPTYGVDSIRDAALWYYALIAILVATVVVAVPDLPRRWARAYVPFLVVLLLWSPFAILLATARSPVLPGSGVTLFSHKLDNTAIAAVTAIAFLWLVPTHSFGLRVRALLTGLGTVIILVVGTQNRGGLVAASAGIVLTGVLLGRRGWSMAAVMVSTVLLGFTLGWGLNLQIPGNQGRYISVSQLIDNAVSIPQGQSSADLGGTVGFRDQLWSGVIDLARSKGQLTTGLGFGPNLAQQLGVSIGEGDPLRSPHNSHVDILARTGLVGAVLWAAFWGSWYMVMFRRLRFLSPETRGILKVCMVGVAATLVNAYFDPTLESPQGAIWLWTLAGLGLGIAARSTAPNRAKVLGGRRAARLSPSGPGHAEDLASV